ncbi:MAG: aldehyde dehydrogenase [Candidatus Marinimicrobia bacterium]|jgi:glyceraldehyde 3-phosphate dehydrogenase|nr:aldehyde dehydrogenase [Candidatus Neomarinimicrobiota bacterium]MBT3519087.1 aldehyde dehydrogenase [Candidatus Neomarinimicrobiota bacterium]MBT3946092.1 aldehyde dehydrogenase [Candidatus Neomarinimicrobiota bacterium]MBT4154075.1 aldehyde dehydrogenase [Candidatus Neomarinimicrobiota bacterium]MBT4752190.1 aldehyde dehydrogenase [Candidatus Neomarinimicrobiota bacterium]|tara:strand:+ start:19522 stop:20541 length:1020 start_codon:yes stop_codon:yes gene_type:complete
MRKPINIALFGFGRIGRNIFRLGYDNPNYNFVAVSDFGSTEALHYLLSRDSVHGAMKDNVTLDGNHLLVKNQKVRVISGGEPGTIPWDAYDVDVVIDATGRFLKRSELSLHLDAGAKRVFVSRNPHESIDRYVIPGINDDTIEATDQIISTTSSTTQVLALMLKMLDESFGVQRAMMTTIHAYTSDQPLADAVGIDLRRSRSAVENIIPNTTFAPKIIEQIMPQFKGKLEGIAFNVPVPNGSCVDLTTELKHMPSVEEVNEIVRKYAESSLKGIVGFTNDPIVSSDVIGREETMVYDAKATMLTKNALLKNICWYDNGWGFSKRILDMVDAYAALGGAQ